MSTFRLRLTYSGLCFFVRDGLAVHVLLPVTAGVPVTHNGMVMPPTPRHYGRIYYDKAHRTAGQLQESGDLEERLFEDLALDLSGAGAGGAGPLPPEIADVEVPPGRKIAAMLHSMAPNDPSNTSDPNNPNQPGDPKRVLARVTMGAGHVACMDPGVYCTYGPNPVPGASKTLVRITNRVVWVIDNVQGTSATWPLGGLDGGSPAALPTLYPIPKSGVPTIDLLICNLVWDELPGEMPAQPAFNVGDEATHYHHFFRFYKSLPGTPNVPRYFSLAGGASCSNTSLSTPGVRPFRCLLAAGTSYP
jgi:hypothetical protein